MLFHTEEMSGFFLKLTDEVKLIFLSDIEVHLSSASILGKKNPCYEFFPKMLMESCYVGSAHCPTRECYRRQKNSGRA